jgi:hypothetical protein
MVWHGRVMKPREQQYSRATLMRHVLRGAAAEEGVDTEQASRCRQRGLHYSLQFLAKRRVETGRSKAPGHCLLLVRSSRTATWRSLRPDLGWGGRRLVGRGAWERERIKGGIERSGGGACRQVSRFPSIVPFEEQVVEARKKRGARTGTGDLGREQQPVPWRPRASAQSSAGGDGDGSPLC